MSDKKKIIIIDGYALIFRAYYAFIKTTSFTTTNGEPTGAVFGFIKMVLSALNTQKPDYVVVAWDSGGKTFRNDLYKEYKANRKETPDELKIQIPLIKEAVDKLDISSITMENYEADDVIGTLCKKLRNNNDLDVIVLSGDKDLLQLVGDNVKVMASKKGVSEFKIYDSEAVKEKWGVVPEKIIDLFALIGDSSDNIPGVKGIGKKGAEKLLNEFSSIDEIFDNIEKVRNTRNKNILKKDDAKKSAELSKELVTINTDLDINIDLEKFETYDFTTKEAIEFFNRFELNSIKKSELPKKTNHGVEFIKLSKDDIKSQSNKKSSPKTNYEGQQSLLNFLDNQYKIATNEANNEKGKYKAILTQSELNKCLEEIENVKLLSFDFETTSEEPVQAEIIGFSLSWKEKEAYYIPVKHDVDTDFTEDYINDFLKKLFSNKEIKIIGQNIKYEYMILEKIGIDISNIHFDTMLGAYVLDPDYSPFNLDKLADRFLNYQTVKYKDIVPKKSTLLDVDFDTVVNYACEDADIALRLYNVLKPEIDESPVKNLFYDIEMPLIKVLGDIELAGVNIDITYFKNMSSKMEKELKALQQKIYDLNDGEEFNINSPKQLQEILFDKLGLKSTKKTGAGARSTDVTVLEALSDEHDIPKLILEYRTLAKLKNTYLDTLPEMIYEKTGRIHASFNQAITSTGRLSSSNPNMQNIPIKGELGRSIRKGFIPFDKGHTILSADYSQIELRLLAHFSGEEKLIDAYNNNKDLHTQTASLLFDKPETEITSDERTKGKTINFSIIYGIGARKLAKDLGIKTKEASKLIETYFEKYPKVKEYIKTQKEGLKKDIRVFTLYNRVRYIKQFFSRRRVEKSHAERLAVNSPIQGTSADLIKIAMNNIYKEFHKEKLKTRMIIQVHDELVFDVVEEEFEKAQSIIVNCMENVASLKVPLRVSINNGNNWGEAH